MHNVTVLNLGKLLTDPLLVLLTIAIAAIVVARRGQKRRRALNVALAALLLLAFLSTGVAARMIERVTMLRTRSAERPDVIVVAGSGSVRGESPQFDVLNDSTEGRVLTGIDWWKQHRTAKLIVAGADRTPTGPSIRTAELMRELAIRRGVPASAIVMETRSLSTREHPLRLRELPGITLDTRVGLVTSAWHMRRALREFRSHFPHVLPYAAELMPPRPLIAQDFLPSSIELRRTARMLQEWIGIAWYALRR